MSSSQAGEGVSLVKAGRARPGFYQLGLYEVHRHGPHRRFVVTAMKRISLFCFLSIFKRQTTVQLIEKNNSQDYFCIFDIF